MLHDIGILVNSLLFPEDFGDVIEQSFADKTPLEVVERQVLGFTHAETGKILAEKWRLPVIISEVIEFHHHPAAEEVPQQVTQLVGTADLLSKTRLSDKNSQTQEQIVIDFCQSFSAGKFHFVGRILVSCLRLYQRSKSNRRSRFW